MTAITGFWSYAHKDDAAESGRIAQLARDVCAQFEMLTGEEIELFLDRDKLDWGDDWRSKIDSTLASVAFFVPVITPRYFKSEECRRELNFFARKAERIGMKELVLPLKWVDFPELENKDTVDESIALVSRFQWSVWTEMRFAERDSAAYRKAVAELAERLMLANAAAEKSEAALDIDDFESGTGGDEPGTLDRLGAMEESIPQMADIMVQVATELNRITAVVQDASSKLETSKNTANEFAKRLRIARELATNLEPPSDAMLSLGGEFSSAVNEVDDGVRAVIDRYPYEVNENPESAENFHSFFQVVREVVAASEQSLEAVEEMIRQIEPADKMSRDLRNPLRVLRQGLNLLVDGMTVMRDWVTLIEAAENLVENER